MNEMTNRQIEGLLEAILIIEEALNDREEFQKAVRRIQQTIEKGATEPDQGNR